MVVRKTDTNASSRDDASEEVPSLSFSGDKAETPIETAPIRELLDEMDECIFLVDENRRVLYRNKAATRLYDLVIRRRFNCSIDECGGALWTLFVAGNMRSIQADEFTCNVTVGRMEVPERLRPAGSRDIWKISATIEENVLPRGLSNLEERFGMTPRQAEIVRLICRGYSNRDIANELCLSLSTVNKHIENIYVKTGASNRLDLLNRVSK
jgi:DNA-binding CsgD family transcriptional regulator